MEMGHTQHVTSSTISLLLANQVEDILNGRDDQLKADKTIKEKESTGMGNVSEVRKKSSSEGPTGSGAAARGQAETFINQTGSPPSLPPLQSLTASEVRQGSYPGPDRANLSQSQLQSLRPRSWPAGRWTRTSLSQPRQLRPALSHRSFQGGRVRKKKILPL